MWNRVSHSVSSTARRARCAAKEECQFSNSESDLTKPSRYCTVPDRSRSLSATVLCVRVISKNGYTNEESSVQERLRERGA